MSQASTREAGLLLALLDRVDPADAEQLNNLGVVLHRHGLTASAIEAFSTAAVVDPSFHLARRNAVRALTERDGTQPRLDAYRAQAASEPDAAAPWVTLARLAFVRGDAAELATAVAAARRLGATEAWCRWLDVAEAVEVGDLEAAASALAVEGREDAAGWRWAALIAYRRGDLRAARERIAVAVARGPSDPDTQLLRAFILGDLGETEAARQAYQSAVLLRPSVGRVEPHLALDGGRPLGAPDGEANDARTVVAEAAPSRAAARRAIGLAALAMGHTAVAERALESAFAVVPDVRGATALATIAMGRGDLATAFRWFDRLVAEHPDDAVLWNARGVAAHRLGRWAEAEASYRRALTLAPTDPLVLGNLAVVLAHQGRLADAVPVARAAAVAGPRAVRRNAAGILAAAGAVPEAHALLSALLADAPTREEVPLLWYALARLAYASGAMASARTSAERATLADPSFAAAWHLQAAALDTAGHPIAAAIATDRGLVAAPIVTSPGYELVTHDGSSERRAG